MALNRSHTTAVKHEVVGKEDIFGIDGSDWDGDYPGDAEEELVGHIETIKSKPDANNHHGDNYDGDEDGVDDDAVASPLQRVFEFATFA